MAILLFIDDNRDTLNLLEQAARILGHSSITCQTSERGLVLASQFKPDLIFVDFNLSSSSGDQFCQRLRQTDGMQATPIIVISAALTSEQATRALAAGAIRCMQKPLSLEDLTQAIHSIQDV